MEEEFELPVVYKGQELILKASLIATGYTHKFSVEVDEQIIVFEPDEQRNYRAILSYGDLDKKNNVDVELLKRIAEVIEHLFK